MADVPKQGEWIWAWFPGDIKAEGKVTITDRVRVEGLVTVTDNGGTFLLADLDDVIWAGTAKTMWGAIE